MICNEILIYSIFFTNICANYNYIYIALKILNFFCFYLFIPYYTLFLSKYLKLWVRLKVKYFIYCFKFTNKIVCIYTFSIFFFFYFKTFFWNTLSFFSILQVLRIGKFFLAICCCININKISIIIDKLMGSKINYQLS
jgi:hypothetical protein